LVDDFAGLFNWDVPAKNSSAVTGVYDPNDQPLGFKCRASSHTCLAAFFLPLASFRKDLGFGMMIVGFDPSRSPPIRQGSAVM
jgi:hypothetical protein